MGHFEQMYEHLQKIKERFDKTKEVFDASDKRLEDLRKRHEEEMIKLLDGIEKRDDLIKEFLEKKENEELRKLLEDIGHLIDEMFNTRLKLVEQEEALNKKNNPKD